MAGILANSASVTMVSGDTAADKAVSGYLTGEEIALSVTPTGASYVWTLARPGGSAGRAALSDDDAATCTFTPDVAGYYTVALTVDATTTYVLRISATQVATGTTLEALRLQAKATDAAVAAPSTGAALFYSTLAGGLVERTAAGLVLPLRPGSVGAALTDGNATIQIGEGVHRVLPAATLSANRTLTLGTTGAALGHVLEVHRRDATAFTVACVNGGPGAGTLLTLPVSEQHSAAFRFDGTNWALHERRRLA